MNLKKVLAGACAGAVALSTFAIPAFADDSVVLLSKEIATYTISGDTTYFVGDVSDYETMIMK